MRRFIALFRDVSLEISLIAEPGVPGRHMHGKSFGRLVTGKYECNYMNIFK